MNRCRIIVSPAVSWVTRTWSAKTQVKEERMASSRIPVIGYVRQMTKRRNQPEYGQLVTLHELPRTILFIHHRSVWVSLV
jgi:hypothetical protein